MIRRGVQLGLVLAALAGAVRAQAPAAPLLFAIRDVADVTLDWDPVAGATLYRILRTPDLAIPFVEIGQTPTPGYRDAGVVPGPPANPALLYYVVVAENLSGPGPRSNMAFKANVPLPCSSFTPCYVPVALPYFYLPGGRGAPPATSLDLCRENSLLQAVRRGATPCKLRTSPCSSGIGQFPLVPGEGYLVRVSTTTSLDLVGSHDPAYLPGGTSSVLAQNCVTSPCTGPSRPLVSVPYHSVARTAAALCAEMAAAGQPLLGIEEEGWDGARNSYFYCGTKLRDLDLQPGRAYSFLVIADRAWQPVVP